MRVVGKKGGKKGAGVHVDVALAKVPEADLVEIVEADGLGDAVD